MEGANYPKTFLGNWWHCSTSSGLSAGGSDMVCEIAPLTKFQKTFYLIIIFSFFPNSYSRFLTYLISLFVTVNLYELGTLKITNIDCISIF